MRLIDLSPPVSPRIAVFPGDVPFSRAFQMRMAEGAIVDLSSVTTTLHVGAHADAPNHYRVGAPGIGERDLGLYYGPCEVMWVTVAPGARIAVDDLPHAPRAPRLLLRTGTYPDPDRWEPGFASLSPALVDHLADRGVVLVGIDTPSIDPWDDGAMQSHQVVARRDVAVLEGLVLDEAPPGIYTLIALPLRLAGADGSPVRAVLVADP